MQTTATASETQLTFTRFDRMCAKYPERPAVVYLGETFSYRRLSGDPAHRRRRRTGLPDLHIP